MCVYVCVNVFKYVLSSCNNSYAIGCGWVDEGISGIILTRHKHCCTMLYVFLHTLCICEYA